MTQDSQVAEWSRIHLPMQETQVQSLDQEDPLERRMAPHSSVPDWEIPRTEETRGLTVHRVTQSQMMTEVTNSSNCGIMPTLLRTPFLLQGHAWEQHHAYTSQDTFPTAGTHLRTASCLHFSGHPSLLQGHAWEHHHAYTSQDTLPHCRDTPENTIMPPLLRTPFPTAGTRLRTASKAQWLLHPQGLGLPSPQQALRLESGNGRDPTQWSNTLPLLVYPFLPIWLLLASSLLSF